MKLFSLGNEEKVFIKKEAVEGVLETPTSANAVLVIAATAIGQEIEKIEDAQLRGSRSRLTPIKGRTHPGEWSLKTYCKPSGTPETPPEADVLFECLMGTKDVSGGKVTYEFDSDTNLPSFSMWVKKGHAVFALEGCTVNQATFSVSGGEIVSIDWSGQFMIWYYAGTDELAEQATASSSTITVKDAKRFRGANKIRINIGSDDNSGEGYLVTSINYSTNQLGISPVLGTTQNANALVTGWCPTESTEVGSPVHGKITTVTIGSLNATLLGAQVNVVNNIRYYEDEMNQQWYPTAYGAVGVRGVEGSMSLYFRRQVMQYFYKAEYQVSEALSILCGNATGSKMQLYMPKIEYKTPTISGDEEIMTELGFTAVATSNLDDELKIVFE